MALVRIIFAADAPNQLDSSLLLNGVRCLMRHRAKVRCAAEHHMVTACERQSVHGP